MFAALPIRIEEPAWLLLLLLLIPVLLITWRSRGGMSRGKAVTTASFRTMLIVLLAVSLAGPVWEKRGKGLTVTVVLDRSQSIPLPLRDYAVDFLRAAAERKERDEDRVGVVTVARDATIAAMPDAYTRVSAGGGELDRSATNLAEGIRRALAVMPSDTANRIVLASDGNETTDSLLEAAEIARANNVPIDVLPLEYEHANEVIFESVITRSRARLGQTSDVRLVLRSQGTASGTVSLRMNGRPLDINGAAEGDGRRVELDPGLQVIQVPVSLLDDGPQIFEASFEPDDPAMDEVDRNNSAVAVTFVGASGKVLIIDDTLTESRHLARALEEAELGVDIVAPDAMQGGLVFLSGYDAVVLANVPQYAFTETQDEMLRAYVHDLGGGLAMIGGPDSFGAGGWIDSEVAKALPVKLNPPQTRQIPAGALALIMHSCEMPQGNFWGQKVAQSAIEALTRLDYVGIVEFNWNNMNAGNQGASWAFPMQRVGDKSGAINATKTMVVGDMPAFDPSMTLAHGGLMNVPAAQRHAIIISDGDPSPPTRQTLNQYVNNGITVTTVMVGGHGTATDRNNMQMVAGRTGGRFYNITNPKNLPQIFIKEAQFVSRSLIQEGKVFPTSVVSNLPGPTQGFSATPSVRGYVLTAPREGLAQTPIVIQTEEAADPLFANWNYGIGKSIAYTSDLTELWGSEWAGWAQFQAFWEQAIRWVMRPSSPSNILVDARRDGDRAVVEVEALGADASFLNFLRMSGVVLSPEAEAEPLQLQQTGPGRYRAEFETDEPGAYLVNVAYQQAGEGGSSGTIQAAVTVPYAQEFRAVKHNAALLEDVAARTGGRVLDQGDPALVDLFDRRGLEVPKSPKRIWDLLAIIATILLLFDVAARRLSIDRQRVAEAARGAVGRRGEVKGDTVAAWKKARAEVSGQREAELERERRRATRQVRYEAGEEDEATTLDLEAELSGDPAKRAEAMKKRAEQKAAEEDEGADQSFSRLMEAKRRARREAGRPDEEQPGGDQSGGGQSGGEEGRGG